MFDPNDSPAMATVISPTSTLNATLCSRSDNADWWTFTLSETSYVGVEVLFSKDGRDLRLELRDRATGLLISRSEGGADIQAAHELLAPGSYDILVERLQGAPDYTLNTYALSTSSPPGPGLATRVFCPRFDLDGDYDDVTKLEDFGVEDAPDRWRPESMLVRILDDQGNVRLGWGPLDSNGCTAPVSTPSPTDTEFVLEYALWSHFVRPLRPDTFLILYDCEELLPCALPRRSFAWSTEEGLAVKETKFLDSADVGNLFREELLIFWASTFSESRASMGLDAHIYVRALGAADLGGGQFLPCPTGHCPNGTVCESRTPPGYDHCRPKTRSNTALGGHPTLDIAANVPDGMNNSGAPEQKFTIAHELGHAQTLWVTGLGGMTVDINYNWCSLAGTSSTHTVNSPEWQSAAIVEGFADFYATAVFNRVEEGAWYEGEDVENDTRRYQANCQPSLNAMMMMGQCGQPGEATMCADLGGSNEIDWAGTLWDFTKVVGSTEMTEVLLLLSDALQLAWDPGSTTLNAYNNLTQAVSQRFPANGADFNAAAEANGTNR
jgi:hypothetical protein